jgi:hypothetical protein
MELADQQVSENEGLAGAEIPSGTASDSAVEGTSPPSAAEKPLSLRDQILKNVEAVRTEEAKRARAADGKFTKLEAAPEKAAPTETPKPEANAQPTESNPVGPPSAWKGIWESMTPEARAIAVKRETEVEKGFEEYRGKVKQYEALEQVLAPERASFQQQGAKSDAEAISNIVSWARGFNNPATMASAFRDLARQLNFDLSTLSPSSSPAPSAAQDIPEPLRPVIDQFGQQVKSVEARLQTWEQQQLAEKINSFAKDKPHFEAVRTTMGQLMSAGVATDLESAYQKAIAIHPEISAQIKAAEEKAKADELAKANAEKAKRAALAAVSPSPRPPQGATSAQPGGKKAGVRDSILASVRELQEERRA